MQLADREEQIIRIQSQSFQSELTAELEATLKLEVVGITQATIEGIFFKFHGGSGQAGNSALLLSLINCASEGILNRPLMRSWM